MLGVPHDYGAGTPLSLSSGCKGTSTASQAPLDTRSSKLACGLPHSAHPNSFPSSRGYCCSGNNVLQVRFTSRSLLIPCQPGLSPSN